jgi:hypothetical protein
VGAQVVAAVEAVLPPVLVFPSGWTGYAPYLALPALAGAARRSGHAVDLLDLDLEYCDHVRSRERPRTRLEDCRERLTHASSWRERRHLSTPHRSGHAEHHISR